MKKNADFLKFDPNPLLSPQKWPEPLTSDDLAEAFEKQLSYYDNKTETDGPNRCDWVDEFNKWIGVPLGSAYCLTGILFNLRRLEAQFAVRFDLVNTAGTQLFWLQTPKEYRSMTPSNFCIAIFRSKKDPAKGHAAYCMTGVADGCFETFEFNTNVAGSRDGGGAMFTKRPMGGTSGLELRGFIDLSKCWKPL